MAHTKNNQIPCYKALDLLYLHLCNDPSLTDLDRMLFQNHIQNCPKCAKEYENTKWVLGLVKKYCTLEDFRRIRNSKKEAGESEPDVINKQKKTK